MSEAVRAALASIVEGGTLTLDEARLAMGAVMDGEATPAQLAALLMGLRMRGETVDELAGFASAMRERVVRVEAPAGTIDVVGTGGDGSGTFNVSTAAALVVAAGGVPVAKHGNRAITSKAGSADVLDALGVRVDHDAASAGAALRDTGFAFLFAPSFHPAMKHAGPTRREIGVRTAFNLLGRSRTPRARAGSPGWGSATRAPLPGSPRSPSGWGTERTFVIHGAGIDELPLDDSGVLYHVAPNAIDKMLCASRPRSLGLRVTPTAKLAGGTPDYNALDDRCDLPWRARCEARRRPAQCGRRVPRRRRGRGSRGRDRACGPDDRRRPGHRPAPASASGAGHAGPRGGDPMSAVAAPGNVVEEIAERRRSDLVDELARFDVVEAAAAAPPPRPITARLAAPGAAHHRGAEAGPRRRPARSPPTVTTSSRGLVGRWRAGRPRSRCCAGRDGRARRWPRRPAAGCWPKPGVDCVIPGARTLEQLEVERRRDRRRPDRRGATGSRSCTRTGGPKAAGRRPGHRASCPNVLRFSSTATARQLRRRPRMRYTTFGRTGLSVSRLSMGCNRLGDPGRRPGPVAADRPSGRWTWASPSSTPPTATTRGAARPSSARSPAGQPTPVVIATKGGVPVETNDYANRDFSAEHDPGGRRGQPAAPAPRHDRPVHAPQPDRRAAGDRRPGPRRSRS